MTQPLQSGKHTRRFLFSLDEGLFLASGVAEALGKPSFSEYVAPLEERTEQWNRINEAWVDQRNCDIFESEERYRDYVRHWVPEAL